MTVMMVTTKIAEHVAVAFAIMVFVEIVSSVSLHVRTRILISFAKREKMMKTTMIINKTLMKIIVMHNIIIVKRKM